MCTNYDELTTKWQKRRFWLFEKRRFWKILRIELDELHSIYYTYKWKIGLNEAVQQNIWFDRQPYPKATKQDCIDSKGNLGIHVYLYKYVAASIIEEKQWSERKHIIVPVWGHKDDFVHADSVAGLFTQVTLTQKDWDKYVKPHLLRAKVI
ncbi:MAG: hypothetical protein QQN41_07300 [Nitrosopumilus sp.]